jgi:hypothetical protein
VPALKRLVEPATLGDPVWPLIWVSKSMEKLAATLTEMGHLQIGVGEPFALLIQTARPRVCPANRISAARPAAPARVRVKFGARVRDPESS